jgi:hypothetical protein
MLSKVPLWCLHLAVKTERNFVRLTEITSVCRKAAKELLLSCAYGCFCGLGVGFFLFLRLGTPATQELAGYMIGLFLMAGLKLGFSLGMIRSLVFPLIRHIGHSNSSS